MYKVLGIVKRPAGMDLEKFKQWWLTEHAPKVTQWPRLKEYRINLCISADQDFDGIAEVWFESEADMKAVFDTPAGQRARQSAIDGSSNLHILFTEEQVIV